VNAEWSSLLGITQGVDKAMSRGLYTDPVTGSHHLFIRDTGRIYMEYWQVGPKGDVVWRSRFPGPSSWKYNYGKILGSGSQLFSLISVQDTDTDQYILLFTESSDYGHTWAPFVHLPQDDEDQCDREGSALLRIKETGRIYAFYLHSCPDQSGSLRFVTRPPGGKIFTSEVTIRTIIPDRVDTPSVSAEYSVVSGRPRLHLFWTERPGRPVLLCTDSDDYGLYWSPMRRVIEGESPFGYFSLSTAVSESNALLVAYNDNSLEMHVSYSKDHGDSFSLAKGGKLELMSGIIYTHTHAVAVCGTNEQPMMFWLSSQDLDKMIYSVWDIRTMNWEPRQAPGIANIRFYETSLSCVTNPDNIVVNAFVTVHDFQDQYHTYFTYDTVEITHARR